MISIISSGGGSGNLADYVVEYGTEGIWTWRKWNSGIAECYLTTILKDTFTFAFNELGGKAYKKTYTFPSSLFIDLPSGVANGRVGSDIGWAMANVQSKDQVVIYVVSEQDVSSCTIFGMTFIGKWK